MLVGRGGLRSFFYSLSKGVSLLDQCIRQVRKPERITDVFFLVKRAGNGVVASASRDDWVCVCHCFCCMRCVLLHLSPNLESGRETWGCLVVTGYPAVKFSPSKAVFTLSCVKSACTWGNNFEHSYRSTWSRHRTGGSFVMGSDINNFFFLVVAATEWPCGSSRRWRIRWASSSSHSCARPGACCDSSLDLAEVSTADVKRSRLGYHCVFYTAMM